MESLERSEQPAVVIHVEAHAIVPDKYYVLAILRKAPDFNDS